MRTMVSYLNQKADIKAEAETGRFHVSHTYLYKYMYVYVYTPHVYFVS